MDFHGLGSDLRILIPCVLIFLAVLVSVPGVLMISRARANRKIRDRLQDVVTDPQQENIHSTILRDIEMSSIPLVNRMLQNANWARQLEILLVQADIKMKTGRLCGDACDRCRHRARARHDASQALRRDRRGRGHGKHSGILCAPQTPEAHAAL